MRYFHKVVIEGVAYLAYDIDYNPEDNEVTVWWSRNHCATTFPEVPVNWNMTIKEIVEKVREVKGDNTLEIIRRKSDYDKEFRSKTSIGL